MSIFFSFLLLFSQHSYGRAQNIHDSYDGSSSGSSSSDGYDSDRYNSNNYGSDSDSGGYRQELGSGGGLFGGRRYGAMSFVATGSDFPRGRGLEKARLTCPGSGSFKWLYNGPPQGCQTSTGNVEFFKVLDRSFNKCVAAGARAAGFGSINGNFSGRVFHKGILGDARHQRSRSLHNVGRAIDIAKIEVNGKTMNFSKASQQKRSGRPGVELKFFEAFRQCWSAEARASDSACRSRGTTRAGYFGSLGWDDPNHQHHLHISLPVCDQGGFNMTMLQYRLEQVEMFVAFMAMISEPAVAAEYEKPDKINVRLANGDLIEGKAEFTGEPVSEPVAINLNIKCADGKVRVLKDRVTACDFISVKEDPQSKKIALTVSLSKFDEDEGVLKCGPHDITEYENPCAKKDKESVTKPNSASGTSSVETP